MPRGRSKKSKGGKPLQVFHVPLTEKERLIVKAAATLSGKTLGEFVLGDAVARARRILKSFKP